MFQTKVYMYTTTTFDYWKLLKMQGKKSKEEKNFTTTNKW